MLHSTILIVVCDSRCVQITLKNHSTGCFVLPFNGYILGILSYIIQVHYPAVLPVFLLPVPFFTGSFLYLRPSHYLFLVVTPFFMYIKTVVPTSLPTDHLGHLPSGGYLTISAPPEEAMDVLWLSHMQPHMPHAWGHVCHVCKT